jgi:hypothetical protein
MSLLILLILHEYLVKLVWSGFNRLRIGSSSGIVNTVMNLPADRIKRWGIFYEISDYYFLNDSVVWNYYCSSLFPWYEMEAYYGDLR